MQGASPPKRGTRCERHALALGPEGLCVLCRREAAPTSRAPTSGRPGAVSGGPVAAPGAEPAAPAPYPPGASAATSGRRIRVLSALLVAVVIGGIVTFRALQSWEPRVSVAPTVERGVPGIIGRLKTANAAGRTGAYYLPSDYAAAPRPLLVIFHGQGISGSVVLPLLYDESEREKFIVVAPDSGLTPTGLATWSVPDAPGDVGADHAHIRACIDEVLAMPGVRVDGARTLVAGHSAGGSSAPYEATVDRFFTAFAVLHGGVFPGGLGPVVNVRGWFSTGTDDTFRPPAGVRDAAERARRAGLSHVEYHEFPGRHGVGAPELYALVEWWLRGS